MSGHTVYKYISSILLVGAGAFISTGYSVSALQPAIASMAPKTQLESQAVSTIAPANTNSTNALNWAGYVAQAGTYTSVSGSWVVPRVADTSGMNADATWVGIGGVTSSDLIQAGTEAIPASDGTIVYRAWIEALPGASRPVPLTISPGDAISVSITEASAGQWLISVINATTGGKYSTTITYNSSRSSVEWIEEMPVEVGGGVIGLDNFGTVNFSSGYGIKNGNVVTIQSANARALTMKNASDETLATPSVLGVDGSSFSVSRSDATATPLALTRSGGVRAIATVPSPSSNVAYGSYTTYTISNSSSYGVRIHHRGRMYRIFIQF